MSQLAKGKFYCGTSNIELPVKNKGQFPTEFQDKSRLEYYASLFNSVEINSTFYKLPMPSTITKWAASVPENFEFSFKLWKEISHVKNLDFKEEDVDRFMNIISGAAHRKGCLLVQFPPSLKFSKLVQFEKLLAAINLSDPEHQWKVAVEFRDKSWYQPETYHLLQTFRAGLTLHDKTFSATPFLEPATAFAYLRFHGPGGDYKGSYTDDFLHEYAQYIKDWQEEGRSVYAYFNNTMGDAVRNLMTLNKLVAR